MVTYRDNLCSYKYHSIMNTNQLRVINSFIIAKSEHKLESRMYRLIILSAIIVASFGQNMCSNTYNAAAGYQQKLKCQYNFAKCSPKCSKATEHIQQHINDIWDNTAFEFNRSDVSFNDRCANDILHSYILFFKRYRIKTILSI